MAILCVNSNSAIDKTLLVDNFTLSAIHRPQQCLVLPGGKGVNVARGLKTLGESVFLTGWVGGHAGCFIEEKLHQEGFKTAFIHTSGESRECISVLDPINHTVTEIYEKGELIPDAYHTDFLKLYVRLIDEVNMVIISGSLPQGVPTDFYTKLILEAKKKNITTVLDTSGESLFLGFFQGRPALIKPNRSELNFIKPGNYISIQAIVDTVNDLSKRTGARIAVSLGEEGLVYAQDRDVWVAKPPVIDVVSAVGSGDCLLAGLAYGINTNMKVEEMLNLAVAMGSANTLSIGAGIFQKNDVDNIRPRVVVRKI